MESITFREGYLQPPFLGPRINKKTEILSSHQFIALEKKRFYRFLLRILQVEKISGKTYFVLTGHDFRLSEEGE